MNENKTNRMTRIGIFYDGNYLFHVSNYYQYHHDRKARLSVSGLHALVRDLVAKAEDTNERLCQIVSSHYFRGRLRAADAQDMDLLYKERVFDDVLVREGITTHYLPLSREGEKGIDVSLALEAFEEARDGKFDVLVLVACDGDFQPLLRKLNGAGVRVMVLGWDFRYVDRNGNDRETRTAQVLVDEATYPQMMAPMIDDRSKRDCKLINGLFVPPKDNARPSTPTTPTASSPRVTLPPPGTIPTNGTIQALKNGYGFITPSGNQPSLFFFHGDVVGLDFLDLRVGDRVEYEIGSNDRGLCAKCVRRSPAVNPIRDTVDLEDEELEEATTAG